MTDKVVITGGAGFFALHLAQRFAVDHHVVLYDIADFPSDEYPDSVEKIKGDVRNRYRLEKAFDGAKIVIHTAAGLPLLDRQSIIDINVRGTQNVLEAARATGIGRVVHISSTAVYGVPEKHPLYEDDPMIGVGPYGESKIAAERLCEQYRAEGLIVSVIRPKTFIGTARLGVFQILYEWVKEGHAIPVIGDGYNRYQLLEVEDLVDAVQLVATLPDSTAVNSTFNVGASEFHTVREDVGALCEYAKSGAHVISTPAWAVKPVLAVAEAMKLSPLYKWVYGTADKDSFVSTDRIQALGWKPQYSNSQALIRSYQWYLDHYQEATQGTGTHHRVAWDQGALKLVKRFI
ncbi:MAG: NAD-dependent epimerase/dehydratase family protein [Aggregatilineales bacterium]